MSESEGCVPESDLRELVERFRENGKTERGWIGAANQLEALIEGGAGD